ncbi:uncharacterized protein K02A2.6-like [Saccostrea echinata]|uniref:uncharacterized protein K02A2.6-like n=1 Tax=Saccostrea echinata TaxID=191078 RepID=UPI002A811E14|nr:uncharacterized protein K02A2.6-like [Saccostrea echinata]
MASVLVPDVQGIPNFDVADVTGIASKWKRWRRAFELYAKGKGVKEADQAKALLLHTAGMDVQDIFFTLPEGEGEDEYAKAVNALDNYFKPQANVPYERSVFRSMAQLEHETIEQYITRLRQRAETCEFGNRDAIDERIRDQIIDKCVRHNLRRKLLEKGRNLTLTQVREIARAMEDSERQATSIEGRTQGAVTGVVNKVSVQNKKHFVKKTNGKCFSCGYEGHLRNDPKCPARGKKCHKCKQVGHFEKMCKTKDRGAKGKPGNIRHITEQSGQSDDSKVYAFRVHQNSVLSDSLVVNIGDVDLSMIIDSGASCNIMGMPLWTYLKENHINCVSSKVEKQLFAYGSQQPLKVAGIFTAAVKYNQIVIPDVEFVVIEGKGQALLGRDTAVQLGVLQIVSSISEAVNTDNRTVFEKYPKCFKGVGKLKSFQLEIPIDPDVEPVIQPMRRIPYSLRDKLDKKLDELLDLDIIERVDEPCSWVSPVVCVPKHLGDDIRLCVDMRQANTAVQRVRHPIPTIDEILHEMNGSTVFSKLDVTWAYHQIELKPESREITTFVTHKGLFRYKRLMFGISCAPEMYQKVMQQVLQGCEGVHNIMDDIIVHASSQTKHDRCLENVVKVLYEKGFTLNRDKCELNMSEVVFMGHVLSGRGIGPSDAKFKAVVEAREPKTSSEVRSFLGLVNYSSRFIPDLATVAAPLRELTRKNSIFRWGKSEQDSFVELKRRLADAETLGYYDKSAPTKVIADASPVGLGAVLVQEQSGEHRVLSYASRSLSDTERRYSQTEKEALALVWACERFHVYLYGTEFELLTDHKPLECIYSPKSKVCARIERWVLRMQPYTFKVRYIPGPRNIADTLSRLVKNDPAQKSLDLEDAYVRFVAKEATPMAMTTREIERASESDPELCSVRQCLVTQQWHRMEFKQYLPVRAELCSIGKLVLRGTRIVIPLQLRDQVLELAHEGHPGIVAMKSLLRSKVWWPGLDKSVEKFCKSCYGCQLVGQPSKPEPMKRTELPSAPWQHLAADLLGPLPSKEYIFVLVDYYSRYFEVAVTESISSENITSLISKFCLTHGLPFSIHTDNGPQFVSEHFKDFMLDNGIVHHRTTPLWQQANGEVERQNRSIMKRVRIAFAEGRDWKSELDKFLVMYRNTPHSTAGVCPSQLLFGRKLRTKLPELFDYNVDDLELRDRDAERKEKGKMYSDKHRRATETDIRAGDQVLVKQDRENKLSTPFNTSPFKVVQMKGNSAIVESDQGIQYKRNVTHLKKFNERESTCRSNELQYNEPQPVVGDEIVDDNCEMKLDTNADCKPESDCSSAPVSISNDASIENSDLNVSHRPGTHV